MGKRNERNAGRKPIFTDQQMDKIRQRYQDGETVTELAREYQVSRQTLSRYLNDRKKKEKRADLICTSIQKWMKLNQQFRDIHTQDYVLRLDYMCDEEYCTTILVNFKEEKIAVHNETEDVIHRAFGIKAKPTWDDFQYFLRDRCVPESRVGIRMVLRDMGLDFYDPMSIIEKTEGRMAEDHQWIRVTHLRVN